MKNQAVILISALLLISAILIPAIDVSESSNEVKEGTPFEGEPLWNINVSEGAVVIIGVESDDVFAMDENSTYFIEKGGEIRWSRRFNETILLRRIDRPYTIDEYIMTLREGDDTELTLHRIDLEDGSSIWERSIETEWQTTGYLVSENNSVYILSDDLIIKISEGGDELWRKEIDAGFGFYYNSRLDKDGNLYGIKSGWDIQDRIMCISPDGELRWEEEIEYINDPNIRLDFSRDVMYFMNNNTLQQLDAEDGIVWSQNYTDLGNMYHFDVLDDRVFLLTYQMLGNLTLREMSKDGEEKWNTTVYPELKGFPWMTLGENKRIYTGYFNTTDHLLKIENTMAFDLDGELAWEHDFEEYLMYLIYASESGVIYYSTSEGEVYAYQGKPLETEPEERDPHFLLDYFWILAVVIAAVVIISIVALTIKEGRIVQDTYREEERPTVGEERYQHNPHEWDDGSGSEGTTFERVQDEYGSEPELDSEDEEW